MSNWENHLQLWIYSQLERLFHAPPKHIQCFGFYATDLTYPYWPCRGRGDRAEDLMIDECYIVINHDDIGYWSLNDFVVQDISVWGEKGTTFIHFDDEHKNWWEIQIVR